jgi:glycogen synthase
VPSATTETTERTVAPYRVLHVLDHSFPVLSGYSVRSESLTVAQLRAGLQPQILTGPFHQLDDPAASDTITRDVPCRRTSLADSPARRLVERRVPILGELAAVRLVQERISAWLTEERFDLVHAHSPALWGLAAARARRSHKFAFVYEIRAFWEDAAVDQGKTRPGSLRYQVCRGLESRVARRADAVVGIARHILEDLRGRGIPDEKLFHIPNGVEADRFPVRPPDKELAANLGLDGAFVFGFIGSLYHYEGISWLVGALSELRRRRLPIKLLVVGTGEDTTGIRRAIQQTGSEEHVVLAGRVPPGVVAQYYSVADVLVYPRLKIRLTELTTPLKPLEAMAQAKPVLASNVGGIRELVEHEQTGLLFEPGNVDDFCRQAERLIRNEAFRRDLGERARQQTLRERDWKVLARRYQAVYDYAIRRHAEAR